MTERQDEVWLTMGQAAARFGTSTRTLKRLLKSEGTPVLHLNGNIRVKEGDLAALMDARVKPIE